MNKERLTREEKLGKANRNWMFTLFGVGEAESFDNLTSPSNSSNGVSNSSSAETVLFNRADQEIVLEVNKL